MEHNDYGREDIVRALEACGVSTGDILFTHSNVGYFGHPRGVKDAVGLYQLFKDAIFSVIGEEGTWVMPAFSYSFFQKQEFDPEHTPSTMGVLCEMMRKDPGAMRSLDPNFSIVAIGKDATYLAQNAPAHSFGKNSFWDRFLTKGGTICNFNFDAGSTFVHYVEKDLNVPYRYDKAFTGTLVQSGKRAEAVFYHFVHSLDIPGDVSDFSALNVFAKTSGRARVANVGKGQVLVITAHDVYDLVKEGLQKNPAFLRVSGAHSV